MEEMRTYQEEETKNAWARYIGGHRPVPETIPGVRQEITDSWRRSQKTAVSGQLPVLAKDELTALFADNALLLQVAVPYLKDFYATIRDFDFHLTLSDRRGFQLARIGTSSVAGMLTQNGTDFSEHTAGTNGIGTALVLGRAVRIFGAEHYSPLYHDFVCCAAPVFSPGGVLLGCVNLTGPLAAWNPMAESILLTAAAGIGKQFELAMKNSLLTALVSAAPQGALVTSPDGKILYFNKQAASLLACGEEELTGRALTDFIEEKSIPEALRHPGADLGWEDCTLKSRSGRALPLSILVRPAGKNEALSGGTILLLHSQDYLHGIASRMAGFSAAYRFDAVRGISKSWGQVIALGKIAAAGSMPVLLAGEPGTGKSMLAQAIHNERSGGNAPFVEVDCARIPAGLLEEELFGSTNPATGLRHPGKWDLARTGTLYLDEVEALPLPVQKKLAQKLAGEKDQPEVFVAASSGTNLAGALQKGCFREDLYYLLSSILIVIPPLREHPDDIPVLAEFFAGTAWQKEAMEVLMAYPWPGNIRELEEEARMAALRAGERGEIGQNDLSRELLGWYYEHREHGKEPEGEEEKEEGKKRQGRLAAADAREYCLFTEALRRTSGDAKEAADALHLPVSTFYRKCRARGIRIRDFRNPGTR
ncbi:MAG: sigma-54-dependent Fis family transcriptional regulator [Lachnospiraceae bacterium]